MTKYPRMVRVMEGHEMFGPLQVRRIDWNQDMFRMRRWWRRKRRRKLRRKQRRKKRRRRHCGLMWEGKKLCELSEAENGNRSGVEPLW